MSLEISTYSKTSGGECLFKALGHPLVVSQFQALVRKLENSGPVAIYDPKDVVTSVAAFYSFESVTVSDVYVQQIEKLRRTILNQRVQLVSDIVSTHAKTIFVVAFDSERLVYQIEHLLPKGVKVLTLDAARLPEDMLTNKKNYLSSLNFATNFAFFRDEGGFHTRLVSSNYWFGYGSCSVRLWLCLFDQKGNELASWIERLPDSAAGFAIDSEQIRKTYDTGPFTGQLFIHVLNVSGHDVVKYALDVYDDEGDILSCTHDANAWPSELYAGLPAPDIGERVTLWIQNSHPTKIPSSSIGLNRMGSRDVFWFEKDIAPFASHGLDVGALLPDLSWPEQIEVQAGKYMVRPRYEVENRVNKRIAHVNVERSDLALDKEIAKLGNFIGKGFILPAPLMPTESFENVVLPTPMSTKQVELPTKLLVYDAEGREILVHPLGRLPRDHATALSLNELLQEVGHHKSNVCGHFEVVYDFSAGGEADGWLHALFRYEDHSSGHVAETSFGSHIFNIPVTYYNEPQSYGGPPPGLSTKLYLRLGVAPLDTFCVLIYPASAKWREQSNTTLTLMDSTGAAIAAKNIEIPCSGSRLIYIEEFFGSDLFNLAGADCYVQVRDTSCRLFGYHGLTNGRGAFALDHMFGF